MEKAWVAVVLLSVTLRGGFLCFVVFFKRGIEGIRDSMWSFFWRWQFHALFCTLYERWARIVLYEYDLTYFRGRIHGMLMMR